MSQRSPKYYEQFEVADFKYWEVYLHEQQVYLGRVYIWAKDEWNSGSSGRDMSQMTVGERQELFELVLPKTKKVLENLFGPNRFNFAQMGNETEHLHFHVIPRYKTSRKAFGRIFEDFNWGGNYAPYRKTKFPESMLLQMRDAMREGFKK